MNFTRSLPHGNMKIFQMISNFDMAEDNGLWDVTPYSVIENHDVSEVITVSIIRAIVYTSNVGKILSHYTVQHSRRQSESSHDFPQILCSVCFSSPPYINNVCLWWYLYLPLLRLKNASQRPERKLPRSVCISEYPGIAHTLICVEWSNIIVLHHIWS